MKAIDRSKVLKEFGDYAADYNAEDPKIKLKIDHTYRVADIAETVAKEVDGVDVDLAWLSGMLHDIGRFEQVKRYGTFVDAISVDHANFGADLLFKENLLERFGEFDDDEKRILEISIRNHSAYRVTEDAKEDELPYCHILRDADKVDIFRVNYDTPMEDIYNVSTEELLAAGVTEEVKQCFLEKHTVLRSLKKTPIDHLAGHICLVFELQYPKSTEIVKEQGYLAKLLEFKSDNPATREWFAFMKKSLGV